MQAQGRNQQSLEHWSLKVFKYLSRLDKVFNTLYA